MDRSATIRPPKRPAQGAISDKFQARMVRQRMLEHEQRMEDLQDLKVTAEDLQILRETFAAVKAEFLDLDGLSWDSPAAQEMLLNWHARQATREHAHMSPGGLRMRHQQPRRSLAAVVSPCPSLEAFSSAQAEDVTLHETVRGRSTTVSPGCVSSTTARDRPPRIGLVPMRREGSIATAVDDNDDDIDVSALMAPPGLAAPSKSTAGFYPADPSAKRRLYKDLATLAAAGDTCSGRPADSASPSDAFAPADRSVSRSVFVAPAPMRNRVVSKGKAVSSVSPTLGQGAINSDYAAIRGGSVPMQRTRRSVGVAGELGPEAVKTVLREFFPGIQADPMDSAPVHSISMLSSPGSGRSTSRQVAVEVRSPRLTPPVSTCPRRPRGRTILSYEGPGVPMSRSRARLPRQASFAKDDEDDEDDYDLPDLSVVRTVSCIGWSPSGGD